MHDVGRPTLYGDPDQVVNVFESIVRLVERQPDHVLAAAAVRRSGHGLAEVIERRLAEAAGRPDMSVIVPAFNEERYISRTLDGLEASAHQLSSAGGAVEVIVVDDRSTDQTAALAVERVDQVVPGPGTTIAAARNAGAQAASGRTLVFIDADTWVEPSVLPAIQSAVATGAVAGSIRATYRSRRPMVWLLLRFWDWYAPRHDITQGVCQFFDREVFDQVGGYNPALRMAEDTDLFHRVKRAHGGGAVARVADAAVYPSMRRYDTEPALRLWWLMNPITTRWFRRSERLWRDWYAHPPR
jgi:glycosyltransferase involved in cell wall biosynthesis